MFVLKLCSAVVLYSKAKTASATDVSAFAVGSPFQRTTVYTESANSQIFVSCSTVKI